MKTHELKIIEPYFVDVANGLKTFEVRKNDRDFQVGDELVLSEWWEHGFTGRFCRRKIAYILYGGQFGIEKDYVVMSIK